MGYRYRGMQSAGPNVKRFLTGTYSALADAGVGNIAMNVPIDAAAGRCIQIWSFDFEFSDGSWWGVDGKYIEVVLARTAGTAIRYVNDPDVIYKFRIESNAVTGVSIWIAPTAYEKDFYPAVPFFGSQIHVTVKNSTGVSQTIYVKIWYTDLFMNMSQMVASLQSQVI